MCVDQIRRIIRLMKDKSKFKQSVVKQVVATLQVILSQLNLMECFAEDILNYNMIQEGAFQLCPVLFNPISVLEFIKDTFLPKT